MSEKQTSRTRTDEEVKKELESAKKLLETARSNFAYKSKQIKDLELRIKTNEAYLKNMTANTTSNHKVTGERSRYERVMAEFNRDKKHLEELKAQKKQFGLDIANKKYYINRLNNELKLPFKEVKTQVMEDSQKANKVKSGIKSKTKNNSKRKTQAQTQTQTITEPEKKVENVKINMAEMPKMNIVPTPDTKDVKLKITPTVTLVPHIKHNGKPSKRNFDIQLMDADGKVFIVTKKMANKVFKRDADNRNVAYLWTTYIEACKKGKVTPEFLEEKFFKGQVNLGDAKTVEVKKEADKEKIPEVPNMKMAETGGKNAYDGMPLNEQGAPVYVEPAKDVKKEEPKPVKVEETKIDVQKIETGGKNAYDGMPLNEQGAPVYVEPEKDVKKEEPKPVKVEETTVDIKKEEPKKEVEQKQTRTTTPDGVTYSFDGGKIAISGGITGRDYDYLMPGYESEKSSKQVYGTAAKVTINHTYKGKDGLVHCGGSSGTIPSVVTMAESAALKGIVLNNAVYNDLKRESAKRDLSEPEKKFMQTHEAMLQKRGLTRCDDGVLEYKDCPKDQYSKAAHTKAQKLNLEIMRGEKQSKTTTVNQTGNANVMQQQKGNSNGM